MTHDALDWLNEAFFDEPEDDSIDGGITNRGPLWHAVSPRWGHSMHTMCSYHGMFPAKLVHYFVQRYTQPGDLVVDPFSGRGTTTLQARVEGRRTLSNDLNPLAYVLTRAKASPPSWDEVVKLVSDLEMRYTSRLYRDVSAPEDIRMLFHPNTLRQLLFLRDYLFRRPKSHWSREELMIAGAVSGILHGAHRSDGSSQYLSISMPNTFSMSPGYVKKYISANGLEQLEQNVFACLRDKLARLYLDEAPGPPGQVTNQDGAALLNGGAIPRSSVDLVLTSPPYLQVVNYGTSNWIRLWWLNLDQVSRDAGAGRRKLDAKLDHAHNYDSYAEFIKRTLRGVHRVLARTGVAVLIIGDVATPGRDAIPLARKVWDDIGGQTGLRLLDVIEDWLPVQNKVSRIWGDTKGRATDRDCALVLVRSNGEPATDNSVIEWHEPYKDGGPDAAHMRLRRVRLAS
jgi:DNA methylase